MRMILLASLLLTLMTACSNDEDKGRQVDKSHVFTEQIQTLDKAGQVEQVLQGGQKNLDNSIEEQTH